MSPNVIKKEQHFVPRFYLKRFLNINNEAEILDCQERRVLTPRGPRGICHEDFFYGITTGKQDNVSQQIEDMFTTIENAISKDIPNIVSNILDGNQISRDEKRIISLLMSMLWVRGPAMRTFVNDLQERIMKDVNKFQFTGSAADDWFDQLDKENGAATTPEMRNRLKEIMQTGNYSIKFNNAPHLMMFKDILGYTNLFSAQHWTIYISKAKKKFVTSDNPIATFIPKRKGCFAPTFLERIHYFALTPEICIQAQYALNESGKTLRRKTLFENHHKTILDLNLQIAQKACRYVYAMEAGSLDEILDATKNWIRTGTSANEF